MTIVGGSSLLPTQEAVYTVLTGNAGFTSICAGPFDPAPINQAFPYSAFGAHTESAWYQFQKTSKQIDFVIHVYSKQPTFAEAMTILNVINGLIEGQTLSLTSGNYTNAENGVLFVSARKVEEPDGLTRHLECRWHIYNNAN
jgi:hypothetical protein